MFYYTEQVGERTSVAERRGVFRAGCSPQGRRLCRLGAQLKGCYTIRSSAFLPFPSRPVSRHGLPFRCPGLMWQREDSGVCAGAAWDELGFLRAPAIVLPRRAFLYSNRRGRGGSEMEVNGTEEKGEGTESGEGVAEPWQMSIYSFWQNA